MLKGDIVVLAGLLGIALCTYAVGRGWELRNSEIEAMKGELDSPNIDFDKDFHIYWGGVDFIERVTPDHVMEIELLGRIFGGFNLPLIMKFDEGRLLVTVEVRNDKNETIAKIVDNHWIVNNDPLIAYDRNYNDFAFEVIDSEMMPRIQILLGNDNKIFIGGYFDSPLGKILAQPNRWQLNPSKSDIDEFKEKRLFKYPSERHMGILVKPLPDFDF